MRANLFGLKNKRRRFCTSAQVGVHFRREKVVMRLQESCNESTRKLYCGYNFSQVWGLS